MNHQQILTLIAKNPGIVAIRIADVLNVELTVASEALKDLVEVDHVSRATGTAPNGLTAQVYHLTEEFKLTKEYRALMAIIEADAAKAPPSAAPTPQAQAPASTAPEDEGRQVAPAPTPAPAPAISRMERAIAFIRSHGPVTDVQLRTEIGIRAEEYPSSILSPAVKAGHVVRIGSEWVLGDGTPPAPVKSQPSFGGGIALAGSTPGAPVVPTFLRERVAAPQKPNGGAGKAKRAPAAADLEGLQQESNDQRSEKSTAAAMPAPAKFRCGLWSDGVLELQRNGVTVAELEQDEGETVAAFMARLREPLDKAA